MLGDKSVHADVIFALIPNRVDRGRPLRKEYCGSQRSHEHGVLRRMSWSQRPLPPTPSTARRPDREGRPGSVAQAVLANQMFTQNDPGNTRLLELGAKCRSSAGRGMDLRTQMTDVDAHGDHETFN